MHLDDQHAAELISQSLDRPLSCDEAEQFDAYILDKADGQKYARMLRLQQKLARDMMHAAEDGDHVVSDQLPEEARTRIEQMLADASRQTTPPARAERDRSSLRLPKGSATWRSQRCCWNQSDFQPISFRWRQKAGERRRAASVIIWWNPV
jgi:hypothetical protein